MRPTKLLAYCSLVVLVVFSCIKPYDPLIEKSDRSLFVVSGQVTDQEGYQYVTVSVSSMVGDPRFIGIPGCYAEIGDDRGNTYLMEDIGEGSYRVWMDQPALAPGIAYRVRIITPAGEEILSEYDRMPECPQVDSVYFQVEQVLTSDPAQPVDGIRFYIDLDATGYESRFFRWEIEETWEYRMDFYREYYYDGSTHKISPPDKSTQVCWITRDVATLFTVSTENLVQNVYNHYPLHFVDNHTTRLSHLYSIKVNQYALSKNAYDYWEKLRVNSQNQGGLYEKQPLPVDGNLYLPANPETRVLGFFSASSLTSRRIFVSQVEGLQLDPYPLCIGPVPLGIFGWSNVTPDEFPIFFVLIEGGIHTLTEECLDCRIHGGDTVKPIFWPVSK